MLLSLVYNKFIIISLLYHEQIGKMRLHFEISVPQNVPYVH